MGNHILRSDTGGYNSKYSEFVDDEGRSVTNPKSNLLESRGIL